MDYYFEDFTEERYVDVLRCLKKVGWKFLSYPAYRDNKNALLLRHDVDVSVCRALRMAELEHLEGVCSTYCFLLHSSFYNLLDKDIVKKVKTIAGYGHHIGLHFYPGWYDIQYHKMQYDSLVHKLCIEKKILEELFECSIEMFSFHNPEEGDFIHCEEDEIGDMVNCYGKYFKQNYDYISDSNGYWRFERLLDFLARNHNAAQILLHPVWWTPYAMSPFSRIKYCVNNYSDYLLSEYEKILEAAGRINVK